MTGSITIKIPATKCFTLWGEGWSWTYDKPLYDANTPMERYVSAMTALERARVWNDPDKILRYSFRVHDKTFSELHEFCEHNFDKDEWSFIGYFRSYRYFFMKPEDAALFKMKFPCAR